MPTSVAPRRAFTAQNIIRHRWGGLPDARTLRSIYDGYRTREATIDQERHHAVDSTCDAGGGTDRRGGMPDPAGRERDAVEGNGTSIDSGAREHGGGAGHRSPLGARGDGRTPHA